MPYKYTNIETYNDSFFKVRQDSLYGLADRQGREVLPPEYMEIGEFHEGLAPIWDKYNLLGFINEAGHVVIDCKYNTSDASNGCQCARNMFSYASPGIFKSGYTLIRSNRSWGYLDKKGNIYWIEDDGK
ncbi:MAG: WG repeat-containing protein [Candidatus Azobacteroides sp.]|nr:WG repeat-containing protein [Candidatus Azobacteroides sp.]